MLLRKSHLRFLKAANGVVVITTRRLAGNEQQVTYTGSVDIQMPDLSSYNLCDAEEKAGTY